MLFELISKHFCSQWSCFLILLNIQRPPNPQPNLHSPVWVGQTAVIPSERVQIWMFLFLYGWCYPCCPGVRLQIWVCLICVMSTYSNEAVGIRMGVWFLLKYLLSNLGGSSYLRLGIFCLRLGIFCLRLVFDAYGKVGLVFSACGGKSVCSFLLTVPSVWTLGLVFSAYGFPAVGKKMNCK